MYYTVYYCLNAVWCSITRTDHFEGATLATEGTLWWLHRRCAETCRRLTNVLCVYISV